MTQNIYAKIQEKQGIDQLTVTDEKGFLIYNNKKNKQYSKVFELYQLSQYFYPQNRSQTIIGIQTDKSITMIKQEKDKQNGIKVVAIKQKSQQKQEQENA